MFAKFFAREASKYTIAPDTEWTGGLRVAGDIETDGLLPTVSKVHCIVLANLDSEEVYEFGPDEIELGLACLSQATCIVGHNIQSYDLAVLKKLYGWTPAPDCKVVDTLIVSRLIFPHLAQLDDRVGAITRQKIGNLRGRHSLEAWGMRLGIPKVGTDIEEWSEWTPEMQARCVGDTKLTKALWSLEQVDGYSQQAVELEHRAAAICERITADGVPFDVATARRLEQHFLALREPLAAKLAEQFPGVNVNSRVQLGRLLESRGWVPEERTEKTNQPKIDDEVLETIHHAFPEFAGLSEYLLLGRRLAALSTGDEAWLKHVDDNGRIHGGLIHIGTPHSRAKHLKPNVAQVPNPKKGSPYGTECRNLFQKENWACVTSDQGGLQDRGLGHYIGPHDGGAYARAFAEGVDTHWKGAIALELVPEGAERDKDNKRHTKAREGSKRFKYAFLFGAQGPRAGRIIYDTARAIGDSELHKHFFGKIVHPNKNDLKQVGEKARQRFIDAIPGLAKLQNRLHKQVADYGWVPGLDGRRVPVNAQYTALNYIICSSEAIICKRWLVTVYDELQERFRYGWDGECVIALWVHDEIVVFCRPDIADQVGEIMSRRGREAGEFYQFRTPLVADYTVGRSWAGDIERTEEWLTPVNPSPEPPKRKSRRTKKEPEIPAEIESKPLEQPKAKSQRGKRLDAFRKIPRDLITPEQKREYSEVLAEESRARCRADLAAAVREDRRRTPETWKAMYAAATGRSLAEVESSIQQEPAAIAAQTDVSAQENGVVPPPELAKPFDFELQDKPLLNGHTHANGYTSGNTVSANTTSGKDIFEREHIYQDAQGRPHMKVQVYRLADGRKSCPTFYPVNGRWIAGKPGKMLPYRLPELIAASPSTPICVTEGEKDSDSLAALGFVATSHQGGAGKFQVELAEWFQGRERVYVFEDNDASGRDNTRAVLAALKGVVPEIVVIAFPELPEHGDVSDWIELGGNRGLLIARMAEARKRQQTNGAIDPVDLWGHFDPPPLPAGLLPAAIEQFAMEEAELMGADPTGIAMAALTVCAAALPDRIKLQVKKHDHRWRESARLWTALVGSVSTKKTPIVSRATQALRKLDWDLASEHESAMEVYEQLSKEEQKKNKPPLPVRLVIEDTTIEAMQEATRGNPDGVLKVHDELAGFFGAIERYNTHAANCDRAFYLQAYNGGHYVVDRIKRGTLRIENLSITMLGGIQPEVIRKIATDSIEDGLIQRLCPIMLRDADVGKDAPNGGAAVRYQALVESLRGQELPAEPLQFDDAARSVREELEQQHSKLQRYYVGFNRRLAAHIGKYDGIFARLCLTWHYIEGANTPGVSERTARRVADFMRKFLLPHAIAFYTSMLGLSDNHDSISQLAGYILAKRLQRITSREVQSGIAALSGLKRHQVEVICDQLESLGWLSRVQGPRRDSAHWEVNPEVHRKFAERAAREVEERAARRESMVEKFEERRAQKHADT